MADKLFKSKYPSSPEASALPTPSSADPLPAPEALVTASTPKSFSVVDCQRPQNQARKQRVPAQQQQKRRAESDFAGQNSSKRQVKGQPYASQRIFANPCNQPQPRPQYKAMPDLHELAIAQAASEAKIDAMYAMLQSLTRDSKQSKLQDFAPASQPSLPNFDRPHLHQAPEVLHFAGDIGFQ